MKRTSEEVTDHLHTMEEKLGSLIHRLLATIPNRCVLNRKTKVLNNITIMFVISTYYFF